MRFIAALIVSMLITLEISELKAQCAYIATGGPHFTINSPTSAGTTDVTYNFIFRSYARFESYNCTKQFGVLDYDTYDTSCAPAGYRYYATRKAREAYGAPCQETCTFFDLNSVYNACTGQSNGDDTSDVTARLDLAYGTLPCLANSIVWTTNKSVTGSITNWIIIQGVGNRLCPEYKSIACSNNGLSCGRVGYAHSGYYYLSVYIRHGATVPGGTIPGVVPICNPAIEHGNGARVTVKKITDALASTNPQAPYLGTFRIFRGQECGNASSWTTPLTVNFIMSGNATPWYDYYFSPGTVGSTTGSATIPAGSNYKDVLIYAFKDSDTSTESVVMTLLPGSGYYIGTPGSATVTIYP